MCPEEIRFVVLETLGLQLLAPLQSKLFDGRLNDSLLFRGKSLNKTIQA